MEGVGLQRQAGRGFSSDPFTCLLILLKSLNLPESQFPYLQNGANDDLIRLLEARVYAKQPSQRLVSSRCSMNGLSLPLPLSFSPFPVAAISSSTSLSPQHQVYAAFRVKPKFLNTPVLLCSTDPPHFLECSMPSPFRFHSPLGGSGRVGDCLGPSPGSLPLRTNVFGEGNGSCYSLAPRPAQALAHGWGSLGIC